MFNYTTKELRRARASRIKIVPEFGHGIWLKEKPLLHNPKYILIKSFGKYLVTLHALNNG